MNLIKKRASKAHSYMKKLCLALLLIFTQFQLVHANTALGGWNFGDAVVQGATTTWNATKNVGGKIARGIASIKPTPTQVEMGLKKAGILGISLTVTQELLDAVDYVMDPKNNTIKRKQGNRVGYVYCFSGSYSAATCFSSYQTTLKNYCPTVHSGGRTLDILSIHPNSNSTLYFGNCLLPIGEVSGSALAVPVPDPTFNDQSKILIDVTNAIIDLANKKDAKAQAFVSAVAQDLLEHDEDVQKAMVAQADDSQKDSEDQPVIIPSTSGNSTNATPPPDDEDEQSNKDESQEKIDNVLKDAERLPKTSTKLRQFLKNGGFDRANKDFDSLNLNNIRNIKYGRIGQFKDGTYVNVRSQSSYNEPTLEIQSSKPIKIRYEP